MKLVSRVVCLAALVLLLCNVPAHAADWTPLGERTIDFRAKSVSFQVAAGAGTFSKLRLDVTGNILRVINVKVTSTDGQTSTVDLNEFIGAGSSRVIDLSSAKELTKVEVTYRKAMTTDKAHPAQLKLLGSV